MTAFFNEFEPFAAQWLRNLVAAGHIAPGDVDDRSILDVRPDDLRGYDQVHLFAGIGVWSHALRCAGWPDSRPVWTASFPCQPFSTAGRRKGTEDHRHLWPVGFDLIRECRPPVILGEQVASPDGLGWWDAVQADLEGEGYACAAFDLCAPGVGAPHIRQRLYWMAYADDEGLEGRRQPGCEGAAERPARAGVLAGGLADDDREGRGLEPQRDGGTIAGGQVQLGADADGRRGLLRTGPTNGFWRDADWLGCRDDKWRPVEPGTFPLAHGVANRVGQLRAYGNALVAPLATGFVEAVQDTLYPAVDLRLAEDIFS